MPVFLVGTVVSMMHGRCKLDPLDNFGQTPLFRAADAGRDEVVELLVNRKAGAIPTSCVLMTSQRRRGLSNPQPFHTHTHADALARTHAHTHTRAHAHAHTHTQRERSALILHRCFGCAFRILYRI
eukprot:6352928-Amphidinium_carterae.2